MKRRKFLFKIFYAYTAIVLLYTFVATGVFFQKTNQFMNYQLLNSHKEFLQQVRDKSDTQMSVALNIVQQLKWNPKIMKYSQDNEKNFYEITKLSEDLATTVNSFSNYGLILGVQKATDNFIITSQFTDVEDHYFQTLGWSPTNYLEREAYLSNKTKYPILLVHHYQNDTNTSSRYVTLVKKEVTSTGGEIIFYISFYENMMIPRLDTNEQRGFAVLDANGIVTMSSPDPLSVENAILGEKLMEMKSSFEYRNIKRGQQVIHFVSSLVLPDTKYVYVTDMHSLQEQVAALLGDSMLIFLILLLLGAVILPIVSISTYRPYSTIVQANEKLLEIAEKSKLSLKEKYLRDLLFGYISSDQIEQRSKEFSMERIKLPVTVVILEVSQNEDWAEQFSREGIRKMIAQLQIMIKDNLNGAEHELLEMDSSRFTIITFGLHTEELEAVIKQMVSSFQQLVHLDLTALIGKPAESLSGVQESYQAALELLELRYMTTVHQPVMTVESIGSIADTSYYYPLDMERELISCVVRGRQDQVISLTKQLTQENLFKRNLTKSRISELLFALAATANRILQQLKRDPNDVFVKGYNIYTELSAYESHQELEMKIEGVFCRIVNYQCELLKPDEPVLADQMLAFIHGNYHKDLSLNDVATHFKLSEGYTGRLFKDRTGENFKSYLNMYRVQVAKKLLDEKNIKIDDLAKMVGCNNAITFTRMFKKYEGISPSQYGKQSAGD
ncbi:helix-turn-helix domain-containing protein [Paenibacillus sp. FSL H7-0331]|uniref:helix-turn-helix domain-containing protein n=1 Tax=Paenibacillus sp. FSL H7-0331 TaxID=1920421 RepID=UPI00096DD759|nr:helix-turn-helix domain-containing protein [Paenibacillus sp. FSL H7-0331]OMF08775.1 hypothetical protein BK127_27940 [Paenibacillus sp. FSL H7-0331]